MVYFRGTTPPISPVIKCQDAAAGERDIKPLVAIIAEDLEVVEPEVTTQ
jgi:hypothetical protein